MKDNRLEKEFDEYFKGVSTTNDITADAKQFVKKRKTMPKFMKYISIAASFVLVFAVTLILSLNLAFNKANSADKSEMNNSSAAPGNSSGGNQYDSSPGLSQDNGTSDGDTSEGNAPSFNFYTDSDLEERSVPTPISSLHPSLKFIEDFDNATNASIQSRKAAYMDDHLVLFTAKLNIQVGMIYNDETDIFVEFTDSNLIYSGLADYYDGTLQTFKSAQYYLTRNDDGCKLLILHSGVKYYFNIRSDDENAYEKYLNWVVK